MTGLEEVTSLRRIILCLLACCLSASLSIRAASQDPANPRTACAQQYQKSEATVGQTTFKTFSNLAGEDCLQVTKGGGILFRRTSDNDGTFSLGQKENKDLGSPSIAPGTDVTGLGRPDVLVSQWTGGAHCCRIDYVFEVNPKFRLVAKLQAQDADESYFSDLDHTGKYFYVSADFSFAYWYGSFAGSPVHEVILRFIPNNAGGTYHLALDKMQKPAPTREEWDKALLEARNQLKLKRKDMASEIRSVVWQEVLDLIYTGHPDLAWKYLDEVGPEAQSGTDPDIAAFCGTLKTSDYWNDIKPLLEDAPKSCLNAKASK